MNTQNELDKYLTIVNRNNPLSEKRIEWFNEKFEYVPYKDEDGDSYMELKTFQAYTKLVKHMKETHNIEIHSHSAWRSIETQKKVYDELLEKHGKEWANEHVAKPRESEHHTGLAFDIRFKYPNIPDKLQSIADKINKKTGVKKKIYQLIEKEAVQFGLIKRYHKDKEDITGFKEEAKKIYESNTSLEEYVKLLETQKENNKVKTR